MKPVKISVNSTEYITVKASYLLNGVIADPTNTVIKMALVKPNLQPQPSDWVTANWDTTPGKYYAKMLVGPYGMPYPVGFYNVWLKLTNAPEDIIKRAGSVTIE